MIYRLPCRAALSVRKSLRAVRIAEQNRYTENTPPRDPVGDGVEIRKHPVSGGEFIPPFQGGVSRGSVRLGVVKLFFYRFTAFLLVTKEKG